MWPLYFQAAGREGQGGPVTYHGSSEGRIEKDSRNGKAKTAHDVVGTPPVLKNFEWGQRPATTCQRPRVVREASDPLGLCGSLNQRLASFACACSALDICICYLYKVLAVEVTRRSCLLEIPVHFLVQAKGSSYPGSIQMEFFNSIIGFHPRSWPGF
jgi:hypothetical protein